MRSAAAACLQLTRQISTRSPLQDGFAVTEITYVACDDIPRLNEIAQQRTVRAHYYTTLLPFLQVVAKPQMAGHNI